MYRSPNSTNFHCEPFLIVDRVYWDFYLPIPHFWQPNTALHSNFYVYDKFLISKFQVLGWQWVTVTCTSSLLLFVFITEPVNLLSKFEYLLATFIAVIVDRPCTSQNFTYTTSKFTWHSRTTLLSSEARVSMLLAKIS